MDPVQITAGRLVLRPWAAEDVDRVTEACQDPDIQRYTRVPSPYSRADAEHFLLTVSPAGWAAGTVLPFGVLDATSGDVLASVGLHGIDTPDRLAELGYWCAPWARGTGVTTEAASAVCRWAFEALGLEYVSWFAEVGNTASRRVAEKVGFTIEATLRSRIVHAGQRRDAWYGSLLPGELR